LSTLWTLTRSAITSHHIVDFAN
jgi:hypothetical protein